MGVPPLFRPKGVPPLPGQTCHAQKCAEQGQDAPATKHGRDAHATGYVLLLTLFLLVIAAVAMVGVVRASMGRALAAVDAQRELQQRWGTLTLTQTLLPRAPGVIDAAEQRVGRPLPSVDATVDLGGERFDLTFADEQAKANVNALYADGKRPAAERAARDAAGNLAVRLRPMPVPKSEREKAGERGRPNPRAPRRRGGRGEKVRQARETGRPEPRHRRPGRR